MATTAIQCTSRMNIKFGCFEASSISDGPAADILGLVCICQFQSATYQSPVQC